MCVHTAQASAARRIGTSRRPGACGAGPEIPGHVHAHPQLPRLRSHSCHARFHPVPMCTPTRTRSLSRRWDLARTCGDHQPAGCWHALPPLRLLLVGHYSRSSVAAATYQLAIASAVTSDSESATEGEYTECSRGTAVEIVILTGRLRPSVLRRAPSIARALSGVRLHTLHELVTDAVWTQWHWHSRPSPSQAKARGLVTVVVPGGFH